MRDRQTAETGASPSAGNDRPALMRQVTLRLGEANHGRLLRDKAGRNHKKQK